MNASGSEFKRIILDLPCEVKNDILSFSQENVINDSDTVIYRICCDRHNKVILFFCNLKDKQSESLRNISVYGFFGEFSHDKTRSNFLTMECSIKLSCTGYPIEIIRIHAGKEKRTGKGSLCIQFLESELIPEINREFSNRSSDFHITYIFGISSDLSDDTSMLSRAKFYSRNGFTLSFSHFYKYL